MKKTKTPKTEVLSLFDEKKSPRLLRADRKLLLVLTLVYAVIALLNLGTFRFPTTTWTAKPGDSATLDFGQTVNVAQYWVNANIAVGELVLTTDTGEQLHFSQKNGEMFKWNTYKESFRARQLTLTVQSGTVSLNELAFFDAAGNQLPVWAVSGAQLVDEQHTVPDRPSYFNGMYFDEIYHARTAYESLNGMSIYEWTHPPLGKLIIAAGVAVFGMVPFGWRIMGTLFGIGMIPILYIFAKRIFKRTDFAFIAAALFAFDCMHFTQTRIATIDVFAVFFILLMFLFMYDYMTMNFYDEPLSKTLKPLFFSGLFFGLGFASKWIGLYAGAGLAVLLFATLGTRFYEYITVKNDIERKRTKDFWGNTGITLLVCVGAFVVIPAIIYFASYTPYFVYDASRAGGNYGLSDAWRTMWKNQLDMFNYHGNLEATHLCQSSWFQWPLMARACWFYAENVGNKLSNISSTGNPMVWYGSTVGALSLALLWVTGRVKGSKATGMLAVAVLANLLPWVFVTRCVFIYHYFATLPFMILAALYLLYQLEQKGRRIAWLKWAALAVAVVLFLLMYPAISGLPMPRWYAWFLEYCLPTGNLMYGRV
ncbi:MAG: glycosyltransferase family 39 protein [Clostridiales bacterium]|nr:glycosyltransferase family 39 protein [Clostridiales bacterium]